MFKIRNYQTEDFEQVKEILQAGELYWEESDNKNALERKIQDDQESILVAVENEKVVGTTIIVPDFMPLLFRVGVHPKYREQGIATTLMQRAEEILKKRGYNDVNITVAVDDEKLQKFYEKRGYEKGGTYVWMTKNL